MKIHFTPHHSFFALSYNNIQFCEHFIYIIICSDTSLAIFAHHLFFRAKFRGVNSFYRACSNSTYWMWKLSLRDFLNPRTWNNINKPGIRYEASNEDTDAEYRFA